LAPYQNLPDFQKSVPNKIIDYLAMEQPLVTPLTGEVKNLISQFNVGLMYREFDPESLVNCLAKISKDTHLRDRLSQNAVALYQERFYSEKVYADLAARLEQLAAWNKEPELSWRMRLRSSRFSLKPLEFLFGRDGPLR
jgi:glycosyltransferase involved in cell wall biosynthesis